MTERLSQEKFLRQFTDIWEGGYFEGNPQDPLGDNSYGVLGFNSVLFTTYRACIYPYVDADTTALEIGPGRGAWSKCILERGAKHLYVLDAAPAEHTHFWDYVGQTERATYIHTSEFNLEGVPDDSVDYFFSFGVFCHLKPEMCAAYVAALAKKMKRGSRGFLQFADFDKYNDAVQNLTRHPLLRLMQPQIARRRDRLAYELALRASKLPRLPVIPPLSKEAPLNLTDEEGRGSWHHWGKQAACASLAASGFEVLEPDTNVLWRDPVTHFRRP